MCDDVLSVRFALSAFDRISDGLCLFQGSGPGPRQEQRGQDQQGQKQQDQKMPAPPGQEREDLQPPNKVCQDFQPPDTSNGSLSSDGEDVLRDPNAAAKPPAAAGIFLFSPNL